jgi:hypothetical protein
LHQRRRQLLDDRPATPSAMIDQLRAPCFFTSSKRSLSSCGLGEGGVLRGGWGWGVRGARRRGEREGRGKSSVTILDPRPTNGRLGAFSTGLFRLNYTSVYIEDVSGPKGAANNAGASNNKRFTRISDGDDMDSVRSSSPRLPSVLPGSIQHGY